MASNQHVSKVVYGSQTLIDLTADTVTADKILTGYTAHGANGAEITGTCGYDANTDDATANVAEIITGKTAYKNGVKLTGTMPNRGAVNGNIVSANGSFSIQQGYHDGSGAVTIDPTEQEKIIPANIKEGVTLLGILGTCSPETEVTAQPKTVTPTSTQQDILPDAGYDYLSQVTVNAIPYVEIDNSAGGKTVTIG